MFIYELIHNIIYVYAYSRKISSLTIAIVSLILLLLMAYYIRKKSISVLGTSVSLMAACIPTSFRNILGGGYGSLPLSWFHIIGAIFFIQGLIVAFRNKKIYLLSTNSLLVFMLFLLSFIPFAFSENKIEAISEFMNYAFFLLILFISICNSNILTNYEINFIIKSYNIGVLISSIMILLQYIIYKKYNISFLRFELFGNNRLYFAYMFADMSSSTVYMATTIILLLLRKKQSLKDYIIIFVITSATLVSSARSGIVALILTFILYFIFGEDNIIRKRLLYLSMIISPTLIKLSYTVREFSNMFEFFTEGSGRISGYIRGLRYFAMNPIFGIGYDLPYISQLINSGIPHNTLIYMLAQMGLLITILYIIIFYDIYKTTRDKHMSKVKYAILTSYIGSMIIPGFIASRFFIVISIITYLYKDR